MYNNLTLSLWNLSSNHSESFKTSQFQSQLQMIAMRKSSQITITTMKKYMIKKYNVQGANKREENVERENLSILYVCLTDDKFISMAKSSFYVPEVMTICYRVFDLLLSHI